MDSKEQITRAVSLAAVPFNTKHTVMEPYTFYTIGGVVAVIAAVFFVVYRDRIIVYGDTATVKPYHQYLRQTQFIAHDFKIPKWGHSIPTLHAAEELDENGARIHKGLGIGLGVQEGQVIILKSGMLLLYHVQYKSNPHDMFEYEGLSVQADLMEDKITMYDGPENIHDPFVLTI